jgi:hypothetical protein
MRRRAVLLVMATLTSILSASSAHAQGWRWLEKLSGPGDFYGLELDLKVWCRYDEVDPDPKIMEQRAKYGAVAISPPCWFKRSKSPNSVAVDSKSKQGAASGGQLDLEKRIDAVGLSVSYLRGRSDLEYADAAADRSVQIWSIEGFYDHRLSKALQRIEVGVAAGANWFVPETDSFVRASIEPRVTLRLFDLTRSGEYLGTASLRVGAVFFTEGFTAADFGAIPGTYESGTEWGPSIRFIFDFDKNPFKSR